MGTGCLVWSSAHSSPVCVCLHGERAVHKVVIPLLFPPPCTRTALIGLTVKPLVSIYCVAVIRFLSGVRKGMAVSTITAVKAGLLFFFWTGDSQVRKVMQHL